MQREYRIELCTTRNHGGSQTDIRTMQEGRKSKFALRQLKLPLQLCVPDYLLTITQPALVTYVTAGFPTAGETVDILLGMEAGGAGKKLEFNWQFCLIVVLDVIEMGIPFTDPIADGPTIQKANTVSIGYKLQVNL